MTQVAQQSDQAFSQLGQALLPQFPLLSQVFSPRQRRLITDVSSACEREGKCVPKAAGDTICRMRKLNSPHRENEEETSISLPSPCPPPPETAESNPGGSMGLILPSLYLNSLVQIHTSGLVDLAQDKLLPWTFRDNGKELVFLSISWALRVEDVASCPLGCPPQCSWPFLSG